MLPRVLAKYELLEEVGKGGMSVVYRGLDTTLNREVAVKVLHEHLAGEEDTRKRFQREAHAVAKLRHPNILEIFDYSGVEAPESYIVTEFIHGQTLKLFLSRHAIPIPEVAAMIVAQLCRAVRHAHDEGVIHRDIKPENIMIRSDGVLKLMDFGIAQILDVQRLTVTGQMLGSPAYMAPEQIDGRPQDFRTDVFSLGTLLFELATGELPFRGKNAHEILKRISEGSSADPEVLHPALGDGLARILRQAMAHRPEDRYPEVATLSDALRAHLAEVGFEDADAELAQFFDDPSGYGVRARERLVDGLVAMGRARLAGSQTARALAFFNRVLVLDPGRREVHDLLDRLARRRRLGRTAISVALISAMAGVATFGVRLLSVPSQPPAVTTKLVPPTAAPGRPAAPARPQQVRIPPSSTPRAASVSRVRIRPSPTTAVRMTLDGKPYGDYGQKTDVQVKPVVQKLLLEHTKGLCEPAEETIRPWPTETRSQINVHLRCKGLVKVLCDAPGAVVRIGTATGKCREEIQVPLPGHKDSASMVLRVNAPRFEPLEDRVTVEALKPVEHPVELRRIGE